MDEGRIAARLHELWIGEPGTSLRDEDRKKVRELVGMLSELARVGIRGRLIDAAAGHGYLGLFAALELGARDVWWIERDAARAARIAEIAARIPGLAATVRVADVRERDAWPGETPDVVAALHACGRAADDVIEAAQRLSARVLLLAPCCYGESVAFAGPAHARAEVFGVGRHGEVRRRLMNALIDAERTLRLESSGYRTTVAAFVPPTVTPHNLVWRAERTRDAVRRERALEALRELRR